MIVAAAISLFASILISGNFPEIPFIHRMTIVFMLSAIGCWSVAYFQGYKDQDKAINLTNINFSTTKAFNINTCIIVLTLAVIYITLA